MNIILDPGHGGINKNGNYTTAPNKMYKFPDGTTLYEGVINRKIVKYIEEEFNLFPIPSARILYTVEPDNPMDVSLGSRVRFANKYNPNNTIFISVHNNAGGGTGGEIFTSIGQTKSDIIAESIFQEMKIYYDTLGLRMRKDTADGDNDKESNFYVLRKTKCPAVLVEGLFFDNKKDAKFLQDEKFLKGLAKSIYCGIKNYLNG